MDSLSRHLATFLRHPIDFQPLYPSFSIFHYQPTPTRKRSKDVWCFGVSCRRLDLNISSLVNPLPLPLSCSWWESLISSMNVSEACAVESLDRRWYLVAVCGTALSVLSIVSNMLISKVSFNLNETYQLYCFSGSAGLQTHTFLLPGPSSSFRLFPLTQLRSRDSHGHHQGPCEAHLADQSLPSVRRTSACPLPDLHDVLLLLDYLGDYRTLSDYSPCEMPGNLPPVPWALRFLHVCSGSSPPSPNHFRNANWAEWAVHRRDQRVLLKPFSNRLRLLVWNSLSVLYQVPLSDKKACQCVCSGTSWQSWFRSCFWPFSTTKSWRFSESNRGPPRCSGSCRATTRRKSARPRSWWCVSCSHTCSPTFSTLAWLCGNTLHSSQHRRETLMRWDINNWNQGGTTWVSVLRNMHWRDIRSVHLGVCHSALRLLFVQSGEPATDWTPSIMSFQEIREAIKPLVCHSASAPRKQDYVTVTRSL